MKWNVDPGVRGELGVYIRAYLSHLLNTLILMCLRAPAAAAAGEERGAAGHYFLIPSFWTALTQTDNGAM